MSTEYVILKRGPTIGDASGNGTWTALPRRMMARNAEEAVRLLDGGDGDYVAVPARSWRPLKLETVTRTSVSEA